MSAVYPQFDTLPPELLISVFVYAGKEFTKLKGVCRLFNLLIRKYSNLLPKTEIQNIRFVHDSSLNEIKVTFMKRQHSTYTTLDQHNDGQLIKVTQKLPANFLSDSAAPRLSELLRHFVLTKGTLKFSDMTVDDELVAELLQPHLNLLAASEGLVFDGSRVLTSSNSMKSLLAKITKNGIDVRFLDGTLEVNLALLTDDTLCSAANLSALVVLPFASTSYSLPTLTDATLLRIAQQKAPIHHFVFGSHMSTGFTINGIIALVKAWQNAEVSGVCRRLFPWLEDMKIWKFGRIRSTKDEFSTAFLSLPKSRIYLPTSMKYEAIALVENALDNHFELRVTCSLMN